MSLPSLSIRRPVSVFMFFVAVIIFGIVSTKFLSQELFPPVVYPKLTVVTNYANAAPEEIETLITKPIEEAVGSTSGLRNITSISREGLSLVIAEFGWDQNMDFAALGVREKIDLMKSRLPRDAEEPTVVKFNPFELPVMVLSVSSNERSSVRLKHFANRWIKDEIEKINGVASATISGGSDEEILVEIDQARLKASRVDIMDISKAISESNINYPGGTIKENFYEYLVRTIGEFEVVKEIEQVSIGKEDSSQDQPQRKPEDEKPENKLILLSDVARVTRQTKEITSFSRLNGRENLTVAIQKQAQANTIQVADMIKKRLHDIQKQIPSDVNIEIIDNQAEFIQNAIQGVRDAAVQGGVLAFFVLLIFLRNIRSSALIVIIIPITIMATLTLMYFMGISLNIISLGGIALGVGMLIDSAIVVIENVDRHKTKLPDTPIKQNAAKGTEEVIAPLIASTLTTIMVFLPMIFVTGIAGQLFKELAIVVIATQIFSIIVAFSLLPMLIAKTHSDQSRTSIIVRMINGVLGVVGMPIQWMHSIYKTILPNFLRHKGFYLFLVLIVFGIAIYMLSGFERIVMPRVDQGKFTVKVDLPVGSRVDFTNSITMVMEEHLTSTPEVKSISTIVGSSKGESTKDVIQRLGSHQAEIIVELKKDRKQPTNKIVQRLLDEVSQGNLRRSLRGARLNFVLNESAFKVGGDESAPVAIQVKGNNLETIKSIVLKIQDKMAGVAGIYNITNTIPENAPETKVVVNKDRAAFYRMSVTDLATAAHVAIKGAVASKFKEDGKEIDIRVVLQEDDRDAVSQLAYIQMYSPLGINVPLDEVVKFRTGRGPSEIKRISQERTIQIFAKVTDRSMNDINDDLNALLSSIHLPTGYDAVIAGESLEVQESFQSLNLAIILSVLLVYMIMAAQFESYFQPLIIMFTLPLSIIGVALALFVTQTAISVVVLFGIILLGGIVVNNGIILIDFINLRVRNNVGLKDAILESCAVRFRPILMTAMTSILALIPLALGLGEGSKLQSPMAITVMGGLLIATFLTLVVIPAIYQGSYSIIYWLYPQKRTVDQSTIKN